MLDDAPVSRRTVVFEVGCTDVEVAGKQFAIANRILLRATSNLRCRWGGECQGKIRELIAFDLAGAILHLRNQLFPVHCTRGADDFRIIAYELLDYVSFAPARTCQSFVSILTKSLRDRNPTGTSGRDVGYPSVLVLSSTPFCPKLDEAPKHAAMANVLA